MNDLFRVFYARPSMIEGIARIFDFGNTLTEYNTSSQAHKTDFLALRADWRAVARDFGIALAEESSVLSKSGKA